MPRSDLACHLCRKRKVKCDRTLPQCKVCGQTGQTCDYPLLQLKPGPKIGSAQKPRKSRSSGTPRRRQVDSHHRQPSDPDRQTHHESYDTLEDGLEKDGMSPPSYTEAHGSDRQQPSRLNIHDLSFILHPSHESTTPDHNKTQRSNSIGGGQIGLCHQACAELGLPQSDMNHMIRVFFDNMVAVNLFHEPSFSKKLSTIPSLWQLTALLAAIAGFSSRFIGSSGNVGVTHELQSRESSPKNPAHYVDLAFKYIHQALMECGDEMPPLCVIQALTIATHCQLASGVRGRAWRSLGLCVSLLYETNLHLQDSRTVVRATDAQQWQADEEKRRAFWAIWEMDVFASTIRRTPTAIKWQQMEILLPVTNDSWFSGQPTQSCFFEVDPIQRWKALQDSGNQSAKAWFIIINSLMKDAQVIVDPHGASAVGNQGQHRPPPPEAVVEIRQKLETLANAVRCFSLALPSHLQYRDQYLAFGALVQRQQSDSQRQQHCSIYNIFMMTHLARLMIHRYDALRPVTRRPGNQPGSRSDDSTGQPPSSLLDTENVALRQYYDAADRILKIVNQSCEDHVQHINPFLSSTIWLASAVQLVRKHFTRAPSERSLIKSRFDVLYMTYKRCVQFWDTQTALQRNLESLEEQLENRKRKPGGARSRPASRAASRRTVDDTGEDNHSASDPQGAHIEHHAKRKRTSASSCPSRPNDGTQQSTSRSSGDTLSTQYLPETPISPVSIPAPNQGGLDMNVQSYLRQQPVAGDSMALLDPLSLSQPDRSQVTETYMVPTSSDFFGSMDSNTVQHDLSFEWGGLDCLDGIHDLLAGWTTY